MSQITRQNFLARIWKHKEEAGTAGKAAAPTVLVADDSRTIVYTLQKMLAKAGYATITANDGAQAVEMAQRHLPDAILMDVVMPNMNGFEATRALKADPHTRNIPIIIISGMDQQSDRVWGARLGAHAFLNKPVSEKELLDKVQNVIQETRRDRDAQRLTIAALDNPS